MNLINMDLDSKRCDGLLFNREILEEVKLEKTAGDSLHFLLQGLEMDLHLCWSCSIKLLLILLIIKLVALLKSFKLN